MTSRYAQEMQEVTSKNSNQLLLFLNSTLFVMSILTICLTMGQFGLYNLHVAILTLLDRYIPLINKLGKIAYG